MILPDSQMASLKSALDWWEWFGYISTGIVGIGCIGEFVAEFTSLPKSDQSKHKLARLSLMILILGIGGELLSAVRTSNLSGELIANIEERAADAERKAAEANDRASVNEKEAAQLRKDAAEIEESVKWRRLSKDQQSILASRLKQFAGQSALVAFQNFDMEADEFAFTIATALHNAHWNVFQPYGINVMSAGIPLQKYSPAKLDTGVRVGYFGATSRALVRELRKFGFDAIEDHRLDVASGNSSRMMILVDPRPEGPQGEAKLKSEADKKKQAQSSQITK
jgi:hypothetical protein